MEMMISFVQTTKDTSKQQVDVCNCENVMGFRCNNEIELKIKNSRNYFIINSRAAYAIPASDLPGNFM